LPAQFTRTSTFPNAASAASRSASSEARWPTPAPLDLLREDLDALGAPARRDDVGARLGEPEGERLADARRRADDDGDAPLQIPGRRHQAAFSARDTISRASARIASRCAWLVRLSA
jgi:hypothetical protein